MVSLRELREKDAIYMLEWMHDPQIQKCFQKNMFAITIDEAKNFCNNSKLNMNTSVHLAVVDELDEYLGTVSLKKIDLINLTAEYAIVIRTKVHGSGVAYEATRLILEKAFAEIKLHCVYLYVFSNNTRAIKFYERFGFKYEGELRNRVLVSEKYQNLRCYSILDTEFVIE